MTLGLTDRESSNRFVCPNCGLIHNWIKCGCSRPKAKSPDEIENDYIFRKYIEMLENIYKNSPSQE
ncbi:MAG: hypothetical protein WC503_06095 [Candidatus Shapirobacteria bacterium]